MVALLNSQRRVNPTGCWPQCYTSRNFFYLFEVMRTLLALTTGLMLLLVSLQSYARDYIIEAIIFTNETGDQTASASLNNGSDKYRIAAEPRVLRARARLDKSIEASVGIETLDESDPLLTLSELAGAQAILDKNPGHRVLQALSWTQSEADFSNSPLINVGDEQTLSGTIRIYAPSLLFAELILRYAPGDVFNTPDPSLPQYFIDEQRKLKLNEVHYFDQARFGVVLSVRPQEKATPTE